MKQTIFLIIFFLLSSYIVEAQGVFNKTGKEEIPQVIVNETHIPNLISSEGRTLRDDENGVHECYYNQCVYTTNKDTYLKITNLDNISIEALYEPTGEKIVVTYSLETTTNTTLLKNSTKILTKNQTETYSIEIVQDTPHHHYFRFTNINQTIKSVTATITGTTKKIVYDAKEAETSQNINITKISNETYVFVGENITNLDPNIYLNISSLKDTWGEKVSPSTNHGTEVVMSAIISNVDSAANIPVISFNISNLNGNLSRLNSAVVGLYGTGENVDSGEGFSLCVNKINMSRINWSETTLTFENMPYLNTSGDLSIINDSCINRFNSSLTIKYYNWLVTRSLNESYLRNEKTLDLLFQPYRNSLNDPEDIDSVEFGSRENTNVSRRPFLNVYYSYDESCVVDSGTWWDSDWNKKKPICLKSYFTNRNLTSTLINISYDSDMRSDFGDLRFVDNNSVELGYWFYNNTYSDSNNVLVWVNTSVLGNSTPKLVWVYYNNPSATSKSNISNAFWFADDFSTNTLDQSKWNSTNYGLYATSASTGLLTINGTGTATQKLVSKVFFNNSFIVEARANSSEVRALDGLYVLGAEPTANLWSGSFAIDTINQNWRLTMGGSGPYGSNASNKTMFRYKFSLNESKWGIENVTQDWGQPNSSRNATHTQSGGYVGFLGYDATYTKANVDWIYVRRGVPTEPVVTFGLELTGNGTVTDYCNTTGINQWNLSIFCNITQREFTVKYVNVTSGGGINLSQGSNFTFQEGNFYNNSQIWLCGAQIKPQIVFT